MSNQDLKVSGRVVTAIVVTYHPDAAVLENLVILHGEVARVIVVDNGSSTDEVETLRRAAVQLGFELVTNRVNLGIAAALNIGVHRALASGVQWLFLFDQDSTIVPGFVSAMLSGWERLAQTTPLGLLVPRYEDRVSHQRMPVQRLPDGSLATAITSGTLLSADIWKDLGPMAEELFIDSVDHEYCLRARRRGKTIGCCEDATMLHSLGEARPHTFLGVHFASTNHSPLRRYYQERNKIWIYRHYFWAFPAFCRREMVRSVANLAKLLLVERDRRMKTIFFLQGVRDGFLGCMGPHQDNR